MKGSGRFGKYGDLKRKQRIRQNLQTPPVGGNQHLVLAGQDDQRKKPRVLPRKAGEQDGTIPGSPTKPSGRQ